MRIVIGMTLKSSKKSSIVSIRIEMRSSIRENGNGFELYVPTKDTKFTKDFINIGMFTCSSVSFVGN